MNYWVVSRCSGCGRTLVWMFGADVKKESMGWRDKGDSACPHGDQEDVVDVWRDGEVAAVDERLV